MNETDRIIEAMIDMPYGQGLKGQGRQYVCWHFCREVYAMFGLKLRLQHQKQLSRIAEPAVPCIVLFRAALDWHSGVVWPDGLHFLHACTRNIFDPRDENYVVRKDRLTGWPWKMLIERYYTGTTKID